MTDSKIFERSKNVKVVVLGDVGRSPRMQYHCMSLSRIGHQVDVVGYGETDPMEPIKKDPLIFYHFMVPVPQIPIRLLNYVFKTIFQSLNLLFLLLITNKSDMVVMQNPPAIPAMVICWLYALIVRAKFVIDWHNYAHTIMGLSVGAQHPLVKITKWVEVFFGRRAHWNFCVTKAMREDLKRYGIEATTLYDRPPEIFKPLTLEQKHEFLVEFSKSYPIFGSGTETVCTRPTDNGVVLKEKRPGLLVSSTSWTEDEDFSVLLAALQEYENCCENKVRNLPELICVITGKGPLKDFYLRKISQLNWRFVSVITPWLEAQDYPKLLASADLGVSLHTSSSGFDLPMKVVDMFGCGLPVCAFNFNCLNELVENEKNSFTFSTPQELAKLILDWFENFPSEKQQEMERKFKTELSSFQSLRWQDNWELIAAPVFR